MSLRKTSHNMASMGEELATDGVFLFHTSDRKAAIEAMTDGQARICLLATIYNEISLLNSRLEEDRSEVPVADGILEHLNRTRAT